MMNRTVTASIVLLVACGFALFQFLFQTPATPATPTNQQTKKLAEQLEYAPVVKLTAGQVRGWVQQTEDGHKVNFYQGIRYGRANRFQKPTPEIEPWSGIYDATRPRFACPQPGKVVIDTTGSGSDDSNQCSEDCLFLNVWQPTNPKPIRSVMFWIPGVDFLTGSIFESITTTALHQIASHGDVVVVSANYRLGPLGFLSSGTDRNPGNLGLYDLLLALKWIQQNIGHFGGNGRDVTLFGHSAAGSMLVGSLILSPMTVGLFQRAIMQQGAPNSFGGSDSRIDTRRKTRQLAAKMQCPDQMDLEQIVKCLENKPLEEIIAETKNDFQNLATMFIPNYDGELLPEPPVQALKRSKRQIDLMVGVVNNNREDSSFVEKLFPEINFDDITLEDIKPAIRLMMNRMQILNTKSIEEFYSANLTVESSRDKLRNTIGDAFGDYFLLCPTLFFGQQMAHSMVRNGPAKNNRRVYSYRINGPYSLFGPKSREVKYSEAKIKLSQDIIQAWTHFAKTGTTAMISGVQWKNIGSRTGSGKEMEPTFDYFEFDPNGYRMVEQHWEQSCQQLWKAIIWR